MRRLVRWLSHVIDARHREAAMKIRKRTWTTRSGVQTAWMVDYYDAEGNRQRPQFKKQAEAKQWRRRIEAELDAGTHVPDSKTATIGEAAQLWLNRTETER